MGHEAQGPGGSWEGTEGWSFLMGEKRGQLALTVTSCPGGLLVTISLWTFNIAQIPLHMWHFCFCVMCSSGSICFSLSLSLSGAQGWALATAQLSKAQMPTWKWPCVCGIGCLLSTSEVADTKATSSSAVQAGGS